MILNRGKFNRRAHWALTRFIFGGAVLEQGDYQWPFNFTKEGQLLQRDNSQPLSPTLSVVDGCEAVLEQRLQ